MCSATIPRIRGPIVFIKLAFRVYQVMYQIRHRISNRSAAEIFILETSRCWNGSFNTLSNESQIKQRVKRKNHQIQC